MVVGKTSVFLIVGPAPEGLAIGDAPISSDFAQVMQLADCLQWYLHRQPICLPSLPGQLAGDLCHHPHPDPPPHPDPLPPYLPPLYLSPLHRPTVLGHHPFTNTHRRLHQPHPVYPHHPSLSNPHQLHVMSHILPLNWSSRYHHLRKLTWRVMLSKYTCPRYHCMSESTSDIHYFNYKAMARKISSPPVVCFTIHFPLPFPFPFHSSVAYPFHLPFPFTFPFTSFFPLACLVSFSLRSMCNSPSR
jgi:hypothetical protein